MSGKILCVVSDAQGWANELVRRESRGSGDSENAMRRLEARYGIPWRTFWTLRYRPPRDVMHSIYVRLGRAYQAECERQERLLRHEIEITKIKCGSSCPAVRTSESLVGETSEPEV